MSSQKKEIKPSDLMNEHPWNSVLQNSENESMACSLLKTMNKNGNEWVQPTYQQYLDYKKETGGGPGGEDQYDKIIDYLKSPDTAALFSPKWKEIINHS